MEQRFNRYQRTTARLGVVQLIFAKEKGEAFTNEEDIVAFFDTEWAKPDLRFMHKRFNSSCKNRKIIDGHIESGLREGWSKERIDGVLNSILIAATDEMLAASSDTPLEVLVKEYADLTADFFDRAETSFINAYLNDLKLKIRSTNGE